MYPTPKAINTFASCNQFDIPNCSRAFNLADQQVGDIDSLHLGFRVGKDELVIRCP